MDFKFYEKSEIASSCEFPCWLSFALFFDIKDCKFEFYLLFQLYCTQRVLIPR